MTVSDTYCPIAWLHRYTNEQGNHLFCCVGEGAANQLRAADGTPLHIAQQLTDAQLLNSPDLKQIRLGMLRGEWPQACERCRQVEAGGGTSSRHHFNRRYARWKEDSIARTLADGTLETPVVRYADIRLGNVCNLTCRMCSPAASRLWVPFFNETQPKQYQFPAADLVQLRDHNWIKSQPLEQLVEQCLPTVETMNFGGGEPLIVPEMVQVLELVVASGRAGEIDLAYNTNITVLPEKVTRLWTKFRSVSLVCSIDGFGPLNEYIRRPSKWRDIDRNLHLLDQSAEEWHLRPVIVSTTVQIYNVLGIGVLLEYLSSGFNHVAPIPQLVPLYGPKYLNIQILPDRVKEAARQHLSTARRHAEALAWDNGWLASTFNSTEAFMNEGNLSPRDLMEFYYFSEKSDRTFNDSWRRACPDLAKLLSQGSA